MRILLVEDNIGDIELAREALASSGVGSELDVVRDGAEALDFLRQRGAYTGVARPDLVLLDLNLPRVTGHEVLEVVKHHEELKCIPVVVFSTSANARDVRASYSLHANCYVQKPANLDAYIAAVHRIEDFWLVAAALPPKAE